MALIASSKSFLSAGRHEDARNVTKYRAFDFLFKFKCLHKMFLQAYQLFGDVLCLKKLKLGGESRKKL